MTAGHELFEDKSTDNSEPTQTVLCAFDMLDSHVFI